MALVSRNFAPSDRRLHLGCEPTFPCGLIFDAVVRSTGGDKVSIRVCVLQPIVPQYRVPVFRELSRVPGLDLEVWADLENSLGSLKGLRSSDEFCLRHASYRICGGVVIQPAVLQAVRSEYDVVIVTDNVRSPALFGALATRRVPMVLWGHGFGTHHDRLGHVLRVLAYQRANAGLFYGPAGRNRLVQSGVDARKLFVAPNAIDQVPIDIARKGWMVPGKLEAFRRQHAVGAGPMMLYLGRLEREKLPGMAIEAFVALREQYSDLQLTFIGDGQERGALESCVRRSGLESSVRFLGSLYEEDAIAPWALSAALLIHPGAIGLSIFHAFGYGLPVVTTDDRSIHGPEFEGLELNSNGLTYRKGDLSDLIRCCRQIFADAEYRGALSRGATATVSGPNGRTIEAMIAGFVAAIRYVVPNRGL
jgi:glycosyltransferase involved in cell wall biosynthesis